MFHCVSGCSYFNQLPNGKPTAVPYIYIYIQKQKLHVGWSARAPIKNWQLGGVTKPACSQVEPQRKPRRAFSRERACQRNVTLAWWREGRLAARRGTIVLGIMGGMEGGQTAFGMTAVRVPAHRHLRVPWNHGQRREMLVTKGAEVAF